MSSPEHFQKCLTQMLVRLEGTICHEDDILVFRSSHELHDHKVLEQLQKEVLTFNDQCQFAVDWVTFLGHIINAQGIEVDPGKVKAITEMPTPKNIADCKKIVGHDKLHGKVLATCQQAHTADKGPA